MPTLEKTAGKLALVKLEYHPTIHDVPTDERPRERLKHYGPKALSTAELLAIILRTGTSRDNVIELAGKLLARGLSCFVEACPMWLSPHQVLQPLHRLTPRAPRPTRCLLRYDLDHGLRHTRGRSRHESLREALPPRGHTRNSVSKMDTIYRSGRRCAQTTGSYTPADGRTRPIPHRESLWQAWGF